LPTPIRFSYSPTGRFTDCTITELSLVANRL
jgi:hypothetical protein